MSDDPRAQLPVPNRRPAGGVRAAGARPRPVVEPALVYEPPPPPRRLGGDPAMRKDLGLVAFVLGAVAVGVVAWNVAGSAVGQAFAPGSSGPPVAQVSTAPVASQATSGASPSANDPSASASASPSAEPTPTPTPRPERKPVTVRIEPRPGAAFVSQANDKWCAAAAVQIALNVNGPDRRIDTSRARQAEIRALQVALTTRRDSKNGGAGPQGMVASLERLGRVDYELRVYPNRAAALRGAAIALTETGNAPILLAWRGAHAWVMTGYRATADPTVFANARVTGAYVLDPWYPRVSSIWGRSDKPGVFQDAAEMRRNFLPWKRPEGRYPGRDRQFLVIVPTS